VVDETKNMLVIFCNKKNKEKGGMEKHIEKKSAKFMFNVSGKRVIVDGSLLTARPENRIKKRLKKW